MSPEKLLQIYLAFLRSLYLIHQTSHWKCGNQYNTQGFYGQHLLFQRIYESAAENVDTIAEKMIGIFGNSAVDPKEQLRLISKICSKYSSDDHLKNSLDAELAFDQFSEKVFKALDGADKLSLGLNDAMTGVSNDRETAIYLLKQALEASTKA